MEHGRYSTTRPIRATDWPSITEYPVERLEGGLWRRKHKHTYTKSSAGTPALHEAIDRFASPRRVGRDCNTFRLVVQAPRGDCPVPFPPGCGTSAVIVAMVRPPGGGWEEGRVVNPKGAHST